MLVIANHEAIKFYSRNGCSKRRADRFQVAVQTVVGAV